MILFCFSRVYITKEYILLSVDNLWLKTLIAVECSKRIKSRKLVVVVER